VAGPLPPLAIPTSLNASLLARLDRLAPVREVAQIGAALGRQFSHELVSAGEPIRRKQLGADALARLVGAELIFRRGSPPDAEYTFKHALVQDAAYGTLLLSRRQQIHARIGPCLPARRQTTFARSGHRGPHWSQRFPECFRGQSAVISSDQIPSSLWRHDRPDWSITW
jgi:hypothetical protein